MEISYLVITRKSSTKTGGNLTGFLFLTNFVVKQFISGHEKGLLSFSLLEANL